MLTCQIFCSSLRFFSELIVVCLFKRAQTFLQHFLLVINHAISILCTVLFCGLSELRQQNQIDMAEAVNCCYDVFYSLPRSTYRLLFFLRREQLGVLCCCMWVHASAVYTSLFVFSTLYKLRKTHFT